MRKIKVVLIIAILVVGFGMISNIHSKETTDHNCIKCHKVTNDDALNIIKEAIPDVKILEVNPAQVKGLFEIVVESKGQKGIIYIDSSKKYIISGSILDLKTKANLTGDRISEINKVDVSLIPLDDAIIVGNKNAQIRVIIFDDPDCPYCEKLHQEVKKVVEKRKDISFYIKMYPLPFHKDAYNKAKAIVCEKSLALLEDAFAKKPLPAPKCETTVLDDNIKLAEKLGIRGTPAIILPNGSVIPGYKEADALISLIDKSSPKK